MNRASRLAQVLALAGLGVMSAAHAEKDTIENYKPMKAIAVVADSRDSIAGFCRMHIRQNLINHGYRIVSPKRADVILHLYGSEDEKVTTYLRGALHEARHVHMETAWDDAEDLAEDIEDLVEDTELEEQTYEYRLVDPQTGATIAYGTKYEKSGSPAAVCDDIADDIFDEIRKSMRQHMMTKSEPVRTYQPVISERPQNERSWEYYRPY